MGEASPAMAPAGSWEHTLLRMASEAEQRDVDQGHIPRCDQALLQRAYAYCDAVTSRRSRTFYTAARLLPPPKRRAICALYGFCRRTDDIVDGGDATRIETEANLAAWRAMANVSLACSERMPSTPTMTREVTSSITVNAPSQD